MASINKDPKTKKYYARVSYKTADGKYKQKNKYGFNTITEAKIWARKIESIKDEGNSLARKDISFADYFEKWFEIYKKGKVSEPTEIKYMHECKMIRKYFKDTPLAKIDRSAYQQYINHRCENLAANTARNCNAMVKASLKSAFADGLIKIDPTYKVVASGRRLDLKIKAWSMEGAKKLANYFVNHPNVYGVAFFVTLSNGLRIGETFGLKWEDITPDSITVKRTFQFRYHKKGYVFSDGKNSTSQRTIPISRVCYTLLQAYKSNVPKSPYVFLYSDSAPMTSYQSLSRHLKIICRKLEIPELPLHSLRHTHCSILILRGLSIPYISQRLGHASTNITLKTYTHIIKELEQAQNEKLTAVLDEIELDR